jgi:hypothetical protein
MFLWERESMTVVYVQNRVPHKTLRNMMPKEAFTGVKPEVGNFKIFEVSIINIVTNLMRTLQSSHFLGGPIFYLVFKNGATGSTPSPFLDDF